MEAFCGKVHRGEWTGYTGKRIRYVVNIGIGGSELGQAMVTEALKLYMQKGIDTFLVSNVDGTQSAETLKKIASSDPLVLISSQTFPTQDTSTHAHIAIT